MKTNTKELKDFIATWQDQGSEVADKKDTESLESSPDEIKYLEKVMFPDGDKQTLREKEYTC